jgi:cysteine desulfurase/selenocysteine lyase
LYGKKEILDAMPPFLGGGDMIAEVHMDKTTYKEAPHKFEAGTPAIVEIIGLGAAIDFVSTIGMDTVGKHNRELLKYAYEKLSTISGLRMYGPVRIEDKGGVLAFTIEGVHPHDIATLLDEDGIAIRSGQHCAQVLCDRFGAPAMARISFGVYNDIQDIDVLLSSLLRVVETFK